MKLKPKNKMNHHRRNLLSKTTTAKVFKNAIYFLHTRIIK